MTKTLSRITGKSEEQIEKDSKRHFIRLGRQKEYGLVDAVIDDGKPGLVAPIGIRAPP
ncbi:hypothetical protein HPP92_024466 [Vanilla planifolia]|uniref:ATP-dependent Clp protease proteolytic subunit n=1 Tax=Vanilla planifolia TaxID=51239 RepID=A0A835PP13_VANPL|nr:hypothetical protein HPP92_024466 [Vanilla planifolia]